MSFVPAPGQAQVSFEESKNLANWIDAHFLPLRRSDGDHDPEGLLSTLPAIGSCLLGVFAGLLLRDGRRTPARKAQWLLAAGVAAILAGWLWGFQFPVIKKIWTSSFVLLAGGWSAVLLGACCWLVDGMGLQRWVQPFVWVGLNPIAIYLLDNVIDFEKLAARVLGGPVHDAADSVATGLGDVLIAAGGTALAVLVCWFLHRRRLYLRV
jgi:predicted acyltransferase